MREKSKFTPEMDKVISSGMTMQAYGICIKLDHKVMTKAIAEALGLSTQKVARRAKLLGLTGTGAWEQWEVEIVRQHWPMGGSSAQIALMLNNKSRNAVIGKAHRLGLGHRSSPEIAANANKVRSKRGRKPPQEGKMVVSNKKATAPIRYPEAKPISVKTPITIMELGKDTCRAIVGQGSNGLAVYCGDQTFAGKSFCEGHCAIYFDYHRGRGRRGA